MHFLELVCFRDMIQFASHLLYIVQCLMLHNLCFTNFNFPCSCFALWVVHETDTVGVRRLASTRATQDAKGHSCMFNPLYCKLCVLYTGYILKFLKQVLRFISYLSAFQLQLITVWYVNQLVETWNLSSDTEESPSHKCHVNFFWQDRIWLPAKASFKTSHGWPAKTHCPKR